VLLSFAGAYVLSNLYRSVNAVVATALATDVALTAAQLGLLTSAQLLAFAAFQLPLGLLLDRFGLLRSREHRAQLHGVRPSVRGAVGDGSGDQSVASDGGGLMTRADIGSASVWRY
jgi:MFS family permease